MKKILFISPTLNSGGAERVLVNILNNLPKDKYEIKLALIKKEGQFLEELNHNIQVIDLKAGRVIKSPLKLLKIIKEEKPDIIFSGAGHLSCILGLVKPFINKKIKFIARERGVIREVLKKKSLKGTILKLLYKRVLKNMDIIIMQSEFMKREFISILNFPPKKLKVINNPVDFDDIYTKLNKKYLKSFDSESINLLSVGRLSDVKQHKKMIEVLKKLESKDYSLNIVGNGELEKNLKEYSKESGVGEQVKFWGFQNNPYKFMSEADLFLVTSKREAFPNVILEASSCGLYTIAIDCIGGMNEVIREGVNGEKFQSIEQMVERIKEIKVEKIDKEKIKNSVKDFSVDNFIKKLEEIF